MARTTPRHAAPRHSGAPFACFCALVSLFCALYLEWMAELSLAERTGVLEGVFLGAPTPVALLRSMLLFGAFLVLLLFLAHDERRLDWVLDHRRPLAVGLLALFVLLEISGSSTALWGPALGEEPLNGTLFGLPRTDRSDEWLVFTPFSFSQAKTGFHAVSDVIRGGATDVTMVYAQPSWSVATAFRPFLWGYFVLGPAKGLSFFWCARACVLALVTYDAMLLLANGHRRVAAWGTLLVSFAPVVEWWFAVNGTVELLVFGQGLVLALHHLLRSESAASRWGWALLLAWQLGCYALIIYPAWQIPFVYVFGAMGIWDLLGWARQRRGSVWASVRPLLGPLLAGLVVVAAGVGTSLAQASDAIGAVNASVYPGKRLFVGGDLGTYLPYSLIAPLSALAPDRMPINACESAAFVSLFPLGFLLAASLVVRGAQGAKDPAPGVRVGTPVATDPTPEAQAATPDAENPTPGRVDVCLVLLIVPYVLLMAYGLVGFPPLLAKVTLLSNVMTARLPYVLGYLDVALLVRGVTVVLEQRRAGEPRASDAGLLVMGAIAVACVVVVARMLFPELMDVCACLLLALAYVVLLGPFFWPGSHTGGAPREEAQRETARLGHASSPHAGGASHGQESLLIASALVVVVCGLCVNPVQKGSDVMLGSPSLQTISQTAQADPQALWLTDNSVQGQACVLAGAPTITSVNCYPNLDRWRALDQSGQFENTYNRYTHFMLSVGPELSFSNPQADVCVVTVPPADVPKLGATYWLSSQPLEQWSTEDVRFEPVASLPTATIFRIVTPGNHPAAADS